MKQTIIVLFGGRSVEHEISIRSAANVISNLDPSRFNVVPIGITKSGDWFLVSSTEQAIANGKPVLLNLSVSNPKFVVENEEITFDIVFPVLHGTDGEDGSIQGLLTAINVPVIGSSVLGSAVSMDKVIAKSLLKQAGIPTSDFITYSKGDNITFHEVKSQVGLPFMIKAGNLGSSVGISKVKDQAGFESALADSFQYADLILIESFIEGRELECGILGNDPVESTDPGEIVLLKDYDFYTYEAKYQDEDAIRIDVPAEIKPELKHIIRKWSEAAFKALRCNDFARVDVFVTNDDEVLINEINTIPGFTSVSMYPSLWANMGLDYQTLLTKIVDLGVARWQKEQSLSTSYGKA